MAGIMMTWFRCWPQFMADAPRGTMASLSRQMSQMSSVSPLAPESGQRSSARKKSRQKGDDEPDVVGGSKRNVNDERSAQAALRKNKAYQQLKRDMEQRARNRAKLSTDGDRRMEEAYVDRDRAAAVVIGNKDIVHDLKSKKRRERLENANALMQEEEVDLDIYLAQGEHELKHGDPRRALMYLNKACLQNSNDDAMMYLLRSMCHLKLGAYQAADQDADQVIGMSQLAVKGLVVKAEAQYHLGNFEHALKFYHRANLLRPGYHNVSSGISKARNAIQNSLSRSSGFTLTQFEQLIEQMVSSKKGMELWRKPETSMEKAKQLGFFDADSSADIPDWNAKSENKQPVERVNCALNEGEDADEEDEEGAAGLDKLLDLESVMGHKSRHDCFYDLPELAGLSDQVEGIKEKEVCLLDDSEHDVVKKVRRRRRASIYDTSGDPKATRRANKELLGKLYTDQMYMEKLLEMPVIRSMDEDSVDVVEKKVKSCVKESLDFLRARKEFWQQEKPVYARKHERLAKACSAGRRKPAKLWPD